MHAEVEKVPYNQFLKAFLSSLEKLGVKGRPFNALLMKYSQARLRG